MCFPIDDDIPKQPEQQQKRRRRRHEKVDFVQFQLQNGKVLHFSSISCFVFSLMKNERKK